MKTSNFAKRVEELGYTMFDNISEMIVYRDDKIVATVHNDRVNSLDSIYHEYITDELFEVLFNYARTPIKERKDGKKYYLYSPVLNEYFNYYVEYEKYHFDNNLETENFQTQFTEEEIENHKFRDIMELLVKEEVE